MATKYSIDKNIDGVNGFGLPFSDTVFTATLAVATDTSLVVPLTSAIGVPVQTNNKWIAVMKYCRKTATLPVFVAVNAAAAVPAGVAFAASTSEIEPEAKYVKSGDTLHFICTAAADISVAFYAVVES